MPLLAIAEKAAISVRIFVWAGFNPLKVLIDLLEDKFQKKFHCVSFCKYQKKREI